MSARTTSGDPWFCVNCANEYAPAVDPPAECLICADEREFVPPDGQQWARPADLDERTIDCSEVEPDLLAITLDPQVGIGQRTFLIRTAAGNLLWEPPGYIDESLVRLIGSHGGISAIASSHPHLVGASVSLSHEFDSVPVYFNQADATSLTRPDDVIRFWTHRQPVFGGIELVQCGGHFPGSSVLLWPDGGNARGAIFVGDTLMVGADRRCVSFMRSYPNLIPLPPRLVRKIEATVMALPFDRIYGGFGGQVIESNGPAIVQFSADRYVGWVTDELRDRSE